MYPFRVLSVIAALGIAMLACTFTFNDQIQGVSVGSLETSEIEVPAPDSDEVVKVKLEFGAGELNISPGAGESSVSGTATYNVEEFEPKVTVTNNVVKISQQVDDINLIPILGDKIENRWDLELGDTPMELDISAGGYKGVFDLGGIPLLELRIAEGAAKTDLSFSEVNPVEMNILRYDTGASQATLSGLANANFRDMDFRSGAGDYRLDFSGDLQQDADVTIKSGLSSIVIVVPEGTPATVRFEGGLANVDHSGAWRLSGSVYSLPGEGPELTITVEIGAGNLELRDR
ncbi:MAG: toast rack family protein [Anaerolineales bacterium]